MILLTGATGFVGRQVLQEVINRSIECTVICRDISKIDSNQKKKLTR